MQRSIISQLNNPNCKHKKQPSALCLRKICLPVSNTCILTQAQAYLLPFSSFAQWFMQCSSPITAGINLYTESHRNFRRTFILPVFSTTEINICFFYFIKSSPICQFTEATKNTMIFFDSRDILCIHYP